MSATLIVILAVAAALVLWGIKVQNQLVQSDELCNNALKQINVQQVSRYDAIKALVSREAGVVGDDDEGLSELVTQIKEQLMQVFLVACVKGTRRLVCQDYCRVIDQRPVYGNTLFLSARQFVWFM